MLELMRGKAQEAEAFEIESESTQVGFEANELKSFEVDETRGIAMRALVDGRLGFAASSDLEAGEKLVQNVLESARHGDAIDMHFPPDQPGPSVQVYDQALATLATDRLVEVGQEIVEAIREAEPDVLLKIDMERRVRHTALRNTAGAEVETEKTTLSLRLVAERVRGDDVLMLFEYFSSAVWNGDYRRWVEGIVDKIRLARESATLTSGRMPVLFSPCGAPVLGLPLMQGLNGKNVYRGVSPMAGCVGERLFDDKLTLVDDPTLDGRPGSASHDDEGLPRRRRALIDGGTLVGFVYDLKTAVQAGAEPTASGERGLFSPPSPGFSNLVMASGDVPLAEIVASIDEGLLVESPLGLGQGNIISGAFSNNLSLAFKIERGEIVGRVKDVAIAGNVYEDLRRIEALSRESEWVYGGMRLPYILLPELNVVTQAG